MQHHIVNDLVSLDIADYSDDRREIKGLSDFKDNPDLIHYNATTLFYDCVVSPDQRHIRITAPLFGNFWSVFSQSLRINDQPVTRIKRTTLPRTRSPRCELIDIPWSLGDRLTFDINGKSAAVKPRESLSSRFRGKNSLLCVSKNNDLAWIRDWARFHVNAHGAKGVVLFDNGSDAYTPEDISACLSRVSGLDTSVVVNAPFKYGRKVKSKSSYLNFKFFQIAMLNLARRDMLSDAAAVLSVDIDEMVMRGNVSVFEAAQASVLGVVSIAGKWTYPKPDQSPPLPHHTNLFQQDGIYCKSKWCATPSNFLSKLGWDVHSIGDKLGGVGNLNRYVQCHAHCAGTTTAWKSNSKRFRDIEGLVKNDDLALQWDNYLAEEGKS